MRTYMSPRRYFVLSALTLACGIPIAGQAELSTWMLDDVHSGGNAPGTITGWFTFDDVAVAVVDFNLHGIADFKLSGGGDHQFGMFPFGPACNFPVGNCARALADSMGRISFSQVTTPASFIGIILYPAGPLTGNYVSLISGDSSTPFPRPPGSYLVGPPYGASVGGISGALVLVPEPSSYLALLVGLGFLGLILRRSALRRASDQG